MSDTESQEKGSSSENEDPVNPENASEHAETRDESAIEHVNKPYDQGDIIPITDGDGESPRKKRPWDFEEEKKTSQRRHEITGKSQMKWQRMPRNILKNI